MNVTKQTVKATYSVGTTQTFVDADVDIANDTIVVADHGFSTGDVIGLTTDGTLPTGLSVDTAYYVIQVDAHKISVATSRANAFAGTAVNITAVTSGTHTITPDAIGVVLSGVIIPDNAVITDAWIDVSTTCASAGTDAGTMAIHVEGANDLVSAIAISDATNVWDAGVHGTLVSAPNLGADAAHDTALEVIALFAGSKIKTTDDREVTFTIATNAFTAGVINVYIDYVMSE